MLVLFTDFGCHGPYLGQMQAVLYRQAPGVAVIDLVNDAPATDPRRSAYLLAALARWWPPGAVFVGVVDPGVGGNRLPVALAAEGKWFVGPANGLFNTIAVHASGPVAWHRIIWRPPSLSASFHGRDLFAPVAAKLATGGAGEWIQPWEGPDLTGWPTDLAEVIYIDYYGNAVTGLRFHEGLRGKTLVTANHFIGPARTFTDVPRGQPFWYQNSMGLVEIAANRDRAADLLDLEIGSPVGFR